MHGAGLQLNNGDKNTTDDWECIVIGKLNAVKLTTDTRIEDLDFAATLVPADHILLRLYADLSDRIVSPVEFASWYTEMAGSIRPNWRAICRDSQ